MRPETKSLYEILRVPRDARPEQVDRAYRRIKAEQQQDTTPPDPRLRVMVEHAHDVLMDPVRREAYDKEWFSPIAQADRVRRRPKAVAAILAAVASVGFATWMALRPPEALVTKPRKEVESAIAMAVGRVTRIEVSGAQTPLGVAFALAEGTLATSCAGLSPAVEVIVHFGKRSAPVRVTDVDEESGLCKLTGATTVGSWPLTLAGDAPGPGALVYLVSVTPKSEPRLGESRMARSVNVGGMRAFEAERTPSAGDLGAPLLDSEGRVVGAATEASGRIAYARVPKAWTEQTPALPPPPPRDTSPEPEADAKASSEPRPPAPMPGPNISPERRARLEKAFRPPIYVPSDL